MLTKDLLRVSRAGGGYRPQFVDDERHALAARVLDAFGDHVGSPRHELDSTLGSIERSVDDFKLVRGFAALCERECTFETTASIPPDRVRRIAFEAAESIGGVADDADRARALRRAADRLAVDTSTVADVLYADRDRNQRLVSFEPRWTAEGLCEQYNLSLAQTALFDATEIRLQSDDPRTLIGAVKRLRLLYEIDRSDDDRVVVVTGPDALFRRTRRYGTAFAKLLRTIAASAVRWDLRATIDDRGRERTLTLTESDVSVPNVEPIAEPTYDSGVEANFAARFAALDLDWKLLREPDLLETGQSVMIPDFAFEYEHADFRVYFEVMGFWTPEYVEKKLGQLTDVEDVELIVAVDETLGVGAELSETDHRIVSYRDTVRLKDVVDVLREYEASLLEQTAATVPESLTPDEPVTTLESLADEYGVSVAAIEDRSFPDHRVVGRTVLRPGVVASIEAELDAGMSYTAVAEVLDDHGIEDASAILSAIGYRVIWDGLAGGTIERIDSE
ncbi:MAG: DUF790 family protein [Halobacteriota archaeon]